MANIGEPVREEPLQVPAPVTEPARREESPKTPATPAPVKEPVPA